VILRSIFQDCHNRHQYSTPGDVKNFVFLCCHGEGTCVLTQFHSTASAECTQKYLKPLFYLYIATRTIRDGSQFVAARGKA